MAKQRIVVSVISDLVSDQRVHKVCTFLHQHNADVTLIGRKHADSAPLHPRTYKTERIRCVFRKGILFYGEFNLKLFIRLWFKKCDLLLSNDLDTLLPNFLHARMRKKKLVYDSHEFFTGMPELQTKPLKRKIWETLERLLLPRVERCYTVNQSIADEYASRYNVRMQVVRNLPSCAGAWDGTEKQLFPKDRFVLLLQGAGINAGRGAEELVQSMQQLPDHFLLVLIGGGDVWEKLKGMRSELGLEHKVWLIEKISFHLLKQYTRQAHLGLSLDKPFCLNYELSLPNKIFDYIQAGVPVLASNIKEVAHIVTTYQIGRTIDEVNPEQIAGAVTDIYADKDLYDQWKENAQKAAAELCWEKEEHILKKIFAVD